MRITKIFLAVIALLIVACKPNGGEGGGSTNDTNWENSGSVVGEWSLTSWSGNSEAAPKVYIVFNENNTFEMYQQSYSVLWFRYSGSWTLNGTTLTGKYSDGTPWTSNYTVAFSEDPKRIRLTNRNDKDDVAIYSAAEVPDEIIDESRDPEAVRSVELKRFL